MTGNPKSPEFNLETANYACELSAIARAARARMHLSTIEARDLGLMKVANSVLFWEGVGRVSHSFDAADARIETYRSVYESARATVVNIYSSDEDVLEDRYDTLVDIKDLYGSYAVSIRFTSRMYDPNAHYARNRAIFDHIYLDGHGFVEHSFQPSATPEQAHTSQLIAERISTLVWFGTKSLGRSGTHHWKQTSGVDDIASHRDKILQKRKKPEMSQLPIDDMLLRIAEGLPTIR